MIRVPLDLHGNFAHRAYVDVETYGDYNEQIQLTIQGETPEEERTERVLVPAEARAIAAALLFAASEAER